MTTLTVKIPNDKDLAAVQEILDRFELSYIVDTSTEYAFSEAEIKSFLKTKQDFVDGKTTARDWKDIEEDLDRTYN